jgi:hypothetical protein
MLEQSIAMQNKENTHTHIYTEGQIRNPYSAEHI